MRNRPSRHLTRRRTGGALLTVTAVLSLLLVSVSTGISSAAPVSTSLPATCVGADAETSATLNLAKALIGSDTVGVNLSATAADIPANAGIGEKINAAFKWTGTLDQNLINKAAELKLSLAISKITAQMQVRGPSSVAEFSATGPNAVVAPVAGKPSGLKIADIGGEIETTGGGIITYRVAGVTLTATLALSGQNFVLNLKCSTNGSNLITKTSVKDPDAPTFTPEVIALEAQPGGTASVDLLGSVIAPGKTPLLPETLEIVEQPAGGTASIVNGVFTFTAPTEPGTYSTTVQVCGAPKPDSGVPGISEVQKLELGDNWSVDGLLAPRPVAFTLKAGEDETALIWTAAHNLAPFFSVPLEGLPTPTPENWAPETSQGIVGDYALATHYAPTSAATIQAALEALPGIGAGNVAVTDLKENEKNPNVVTGFEITYQGDLAEQDIPAVSLGQWYSVPPQEILDRIGEAVAGLAGSLGGDPDAPVNPVVAIADTANAAAKAAALAAEKPEAQAIAIGNAAGAAAADKFIGDKLVASITGGPAVTDEEWDGWVQVRIIGPITDAVPDIIAFLNSLFPKKIVATTVTPGEAPTPPQPLCAQGIIDVTVSGVLAETETPAPPPPAVAGKSDERGIGFTG